MERSNVIEFRSKNALFGDKVKQRIKDGISPYLKEPASESDKDQAVSVVEQVICTAIVSAAVALAVKLATTIANKLLAAKTTAEKPVA